MQISQRIRRHRQRKTARSAAGRTLFRQRAAADVLFAFEPLAFFPPEPAVPEAHLSASVFSLQENPRKIRAITDRPPRALGSPTCHAPAGRRVRVAPL